MHARQRNGKSRAEFGVSDRSREMGVQSFAIKTRRFSSAGDIQIDADGESGKQSCPDDIAADHRHWKE
jgi:hypothetical protein